MKKRASAQTGPPSLHCCVMRDGIPGATEQIWESSHICSIAPQHPKSSVGEMRMDINPEISCHQQSGSTREYQSLHNLLLDGSRLDTLARISQRSQGNWPGIVESTRSDLRATSGRPLTPAKMHLSKKIAE